MKTYDCFDWENYTQSHYEKEMLMLIQQHNLDLIIKNFLNNENEIEFRDNLHPNWKELYHRVNKLDVKSVYECGCGCAHHLINIFKIKNNIEIGGCDYSQNQINLGKKYFDLDKYEFSKKLKVIDLTKELESVDETYEFVFTQAVVMHLSHDRAIKFLSNMGKLSNKYIFLIENTTYHNFDEMISQVLPEFERIEVDKKYIDSSILLKLKSR